ncbi:DUF2384 domain-containing protein [Pseudomonas neustonica]|uniref:DUF2384 domain-containing protein n=2 Tax=Pseudomonas TaxID=286 RepID=A0ABX9XCF9_9PSED|nr:DUF2384 domain-containing protein [Pseudomonas sp. SSM44]ROZ80214.1 DUF2384 domain-containing protein [Pseudomonas neustonica]
MSEQERLKRINSGFEVVWLSSTKSAFEVDASVIGDLANLSVRTISTREKDNSPLDLTTSERLDRLAYLAVLARSVFECSSAAKEWMVAPNESLGGAAPFHLCKTELGGRQARRALLAIEWGGVV